MKREEQDKLWAELSEENKKEIKAKYAEFSAKDNPESKGYCQVIANVFGKHNLQPTLTYDDVKRELFGKDLEKCVYAPVTCMGLKWYNKIQAIGKLLVVAKFLNKNEDGSDWVPDWEDDTEPKWYFCVFPGKKPIPCFTVQNNCCLAYFRTEEFIQQAVQILGEDVVITALTTGY